MECFADANYMILIAVCREFIHRHTSYDPMGQLRLNHMSFRVSTQTATRSRSWSDVFVMQRDETQNRSNGYTGLKTGEPGSYCVASQGERPVDKVEA